MLNVGGPASRLWAPDATLRAILDASPAATAVVDRAGHLVHGNAAWRALAARTAIFGALGTLVTPEDVDGSPYARRLADLDGPLAPAAHKLARAIEEALAGRVPERIVYRMHRPEGEDPFEAAATPLPGPVRLALVQHLDLSDRERAAEAQAVAVAAGLAFEELRAESRRAARRLEAIARDLHIPITPVRLQLHLLLHDGLGALTPRQRHALEVIERNVARWAQGEEQFARLGREAWRPPEPLDLGDAAARAVEERRTHALRQGVRLVATPPGRALPIRASPDLLHDVLDLLLARAIDGTPAGAAAAIEVREHDGEALAEVRDGGAGLSPREVRAAFEPWSGRRPVPGASMALPYVQAIVKAAGGRTYAESDGAGAGVLLGVAFPLRGPEAPASKQPAPARPKGEGEPARARGQGPKRRKDRGGA